MQIKRITEAIWKRFDSVCSRSSWSSSSGSMAIAPLSEADEVPALLEPAWGGASGEVAGWGLDSSFCLLVLDLDIVWKERQRDR